MVLRQLVSQVFVLVFELFLSSKALNEVLIAISF